jgi:hypothetical protein
MVKISFETDNDAFVGKRLRTEVVRVLEEIIGKIKGGREGGFVMDVNGNSTGEWSVE